MPTTDAPTKAPNQPGATAGVPRPPTNPARDAVEAQERRQPFRVVDAIRTHFAADRRSLTVPEWTYPDGTPVTLYLGRVTVNDLLGAIDKNPQGKAIERDVRLLVAKAEDAAGKPVFAQGDVHLLMSAADLGVLTRVLDFLRVGMIPSVQEATQALEPTPHSASNSS